MIGNVNTREPARIGLTKLLTSSVSVLQVGLAHDVRQVCVVLRSINQSINQSINRSIHASDPCERSMRAIDRESMQLIGRSIDLESIDQSIRSIDSINRIDRIRSLQVIARLQYLQCVSNALSHGNNQSVNRWTISPNTNKIDHGFVMHI